MNSRVDARVVANVDGRTNGRKTIYVYSKGHNSVKSVGGVMALVLSTLSDGVLYLYQVLSCS